jgi:hypothetical protein
MKSLLKIASLLGLVLSIGPPILFFLGKTDLGQMKLGMGIGMVVWMVTAPFWINKKEDGRPETEGK